MPRVIFSTDSKAIGSYCINLILKEDWYAENGYNPHSPGVSEKIKREIKNSGDLIRKNKYDASNFFKEFNRIFDPSSFEKEKEKFEAIWRPVEDDFFKSAEKKTGKKWKRRTYFCYYSPFGPGGSYWDDRIYTRFVSKKTIMHELVHILLEDEAQKRKLSHSDKEKMIDNALEKINKELMK